MKMVKATPEQIQLSVALDDIAHQYIAIMLRVKQLCPKDFTESEILMVFEKTQVTYNAYIIRLYSDMQKKSCAPKQSSNVDVA